MTNINNVNTSLKIRKSVIGVLVAVFRWALIIGVGYVIFFPLLNMISTSLMDAEQILDPGVVWVPRAISFANFKGAWIAMDYGNSLVRTLTTNVLSALIEVLTCAITAYGFARFKFKGKSILMVILVATMVIPPQMTVISQYEGFRNFDILNIFSIINSIFGTNIEINLINTPFTFIIPSLFAVGVKSGLLIYIYMQFFKSLPKELEEAAYVDGANSLKTFFMIILPSSGVIITTALVFSIVWHWNEYYLSIMYFSSKFTLAPVLSQLQTQLTTTGVTTLGSVENGIVMAACLMFIAPVLIFYLIIQKRFVQSVATSGIVG